MKLDQHIRKLLQRCDCVLVPDFGGFVANNYGASIDSATHVFLPPRKAISFNVHLIRNDGLLVASGGFNPVSYSGLTVRRKTMEVFTPC